VAWAWDGFPGNFDVRTSMHPTASPDQYSSTISGFGSFVDRVHALTGERSAAAVTAGVPVPTFHWHSRLYRIAALVRPGPLTWNTASYMTPDQLVPQYVARVAELVSLGLVVSIQDHAHTGTNPTIPAAALSNPLIDIGDPALAGAGNQKLRDSIQLYDAICAAFPGGSHNVWIGLPNESHATERTTAYDDWVWWWMMRLEGKGFGGIVSAPLPNFAGSLGVLAAGGIDSLVSRLEASGVRPPAWEHHNYGRNSDTNAVYTWAELDAHLTACRNGIPGSGRKHAVWMAEYGQATPVGTGAAGPDAWNREGVLITATSTYGQALGVKHRHTCPTVWALADNSFDVSYSLTRGQSNKLDETGPDPNTNGTPVGVFPWHQVNTPALLTEWGSDLGKAHADIAQQIWTG
jgi:hypothetical protein